MRNVNDPSTCGNCAEGEPFAEHHSPGAVPTSGPSNTHGRLITMSTTSTTSTIPAPTRRPSFALYVRDAGTGWEAIAGEESTYGYGYAMGQRDIAAGLPALTTTEQSNLWHGDYAEGYGDAYADAR